MGHKLNQALSTPQRTGGELPRGLQQCVDLGIDTQSPIVYILNVGWAEKHLSASLR